MWSCFSRSFMYWLAILPTRGSPVRVGERGRKGEREGWREGGKGKRGREGGREREEGERGGRESEEVGEGGRWEGQWKSAP